MRTLSRRGALAVAGLSLAAPATLQAQRAWPDGPIRIVVPFPPGGSADLLCRLLQNPLTQSLGVPIVIENRPGAGGAMGTATVARAAPDGQSFVVVFDTHVVNPLLIKPLGYEEKDLRPVCLLATAPMLAATPVKRPWARMEEVIAQAKRQPDTITYGTIGVGSLAHLTMERLQDAAGCKMVHVPYRGGGPMSAAASAGEIDLAVASVVGLGGQVGSTLRALAQPGETRSPLRPEIPTLIESGVPGVAAKAFWGILGPAGVPEPVMQRMEAALQQALQQPAVRKPLEDQGVDVVGSTGKAFAAFLEEQEAISSRVVREKKISMSSD